MRTINYSLTKTFLALVACIIGTPLIIWLLGADGKLFFAGLIFTLCIPFLIFGTIRVILSDGVALEFNSKGLRISTLYRTVRANWSEVAGVELRSYVRHDLFGIVKKITVSQNLVVNMKGGLFGTKSVSLTPAFLNLKGANVEGLLADMQLQLNNYRIAHHVGKAPETAGSCIGDMGLPEIEHRVPAAGFQVNRFKHFMTDSGDKELSVEAAQRRSDFGSQNL